MDNQPHTAKQMDNNFQPNDWSHVILREWRNSNDEEYAWHLLNLLADSLVDNKGKNLLSLLVFPLGTMFGLWLPCMFAGRRFEGDISDFYSIVFLLGGVGGFIFGLMTHMRTKISWPHLLRLLGPTILDASKLIRSKNFALVVVRLILLGLLLGATTSLLVLGISLSLDFWIEGQILKNILPALIAVSMFVSFIFGGAVGYFVVEELGVLIVVYCGISLVVADIIMINSVWHFLPIVVDMFDFRNRDIVLTSRLQVLKGVFLIFSMFSVLLILYSQQRKKLVTGRLSRANHKNVFAHRGWWSWWQTPPASDELENALRNLTRKDNYNSKFWKEALNGLEIRRRKTNTIKDLIPDLHSTDWYKRFAARQILREMNLDQQFNDVVQYVDDRLCLQCFNRHEAQLVALSLPEQFVYNGCRSCFNSDSYVTWPNEVTVILDRSQEIRFIKREDELRVNWLHHPELFDFDRVDILDATNEDVERFAVQVGNDTDEIRRQKYKQMRCVIAPTCELSDNTLRVLQQTFGEVVRAA